MHIPTYIHIHICAYPAGSVFADVYVGVKTHPCNKLTCPCTSAQNTCKVHVTLTAKKCTYIYTHIHMYKHTYAHENTCASMTPSTCWSTDTKTHNLCTNMHTHTHTHGCGCGSGCRCGCVSVTRRVRVRACMYHNMVHRPTGRQQKKVQMC